LAQVFHILGSGCLFIQYGGEQYFVYFNADLRQANVEKGSTGPFGGTAVYGHALSGTRGAYVLLPAAMVLFVILRFNRQVVIGTAIAGVGILFLILVPTSNSNIVRFQTAFKPNEDIPSRPEKIIKNAFNLTFYHIRWAEGLGATGAWGQRFAPNSYLAKFPPDSGYVRIAVELGLDWFGYILSADVFYSARRVSTTIIPLATWS
jgi:hypothetical protein